jgi:hypothetical protein
MQALLHGSPLPPFQIVIKRKITVQRGGSEGADLSFLPPEVIALTCHADVGHIMQMAPCIAYIIHHICHLLSLDMLCVNDACLVSISYM